MNIRRHALCLHTVTCGQWVLACIILQSTASVIAALYQPIQCIFSVQLTNTYFYGVLLWGFGLNVSHFAMVIYMQDSDYRKVPYTERAAAAAAVFIVNGARRDLATPIFFVREYDRLLEIILSAQPIIVKHSSSATTRRCAVLQQKLMCQRVAGSLQAALPVARWPQNGDVKFNKKNVITGSTLCISKVNVTEGKPVLFSGQCRVSLKYRGLIR
jgi:hypothetical protein